MIMIRKSNANYRLTPWACRSLHLQGQGAGGKSKTLQREEQIFTEVYAAMF